MRLEGKTAIVTGAASGIGAASAELFAREGARVLAVDRPGTALDEVAARHAGIRPLAVSVSDPDAPSRIVGAALEHFGQLDILFNNAGVSGRALAEECSDEEWDRIVNVNQRAVFRLSREAIPVLRQRAATTGRGRIINTASVMAEGTDYGLVAYTASKHAVAGITRTLALELGKFGITANYLLPGAIFTGMTRASFTQDHIAEVWAKKSAVRRLGQPIDLARAALFLASDDADFVTGHGLVVDGGLTLRV